MVEMHGAAQESGQTVPGVRLAFGGISKNPVGVSLSFESREDERNGFIEFAQNVGFARAAGVAKLQVPVAKVTGSGDARTDVIAEIPGQVQHQVANAVAVEKGFCQNC